MSEEEPQTNFKKLWTPWIQSWQFSNHAVFRIPEYLDLMMRDWRQQSPLLIDKAFEPEPFYFFRHPLTKTKANERSEDYTPLIQFAQSVLLTSLLSPRGKIEETARKAIEETAGKAKESITDLKTYLKDKPGEWKKFLEAIQGQDEFNYLEEEIDFSLLETLSNRALEIADADIPKLFHNLFLAFCSVSHRGYLQQRLNECHLPLTTKDRDRIVGYCLELSPTGYDLRLVSVPETGGLPHDERSLVIVALKGYELHIRIFDSNGDIVGDKHEAELVGGQELASLKALLNQDPFPDEELLSLQERQKIIKNATSISGHTTPLPPIKWIRALYWDGSSKMLEWKNLEQPEAFDILGKPADETLAFPDFLTQMFQAVNGSSVLRPRKHQRLVAVPVYEWSTAPTATNGHSPATTPRHRGGALLGWVLNRFPDDVDLDAIRWTSLVNSSEGNPLASRFDQHLRSLSFLAENFAAKYMSGDTEWALERRWENEDTAKSYMERYFHHSCSRVCSFDTEGIEKDDLQEAKDRYFHHVKDGPLLVNLGKGTSPHDPNGSADDVIAVLTPTIHFLKPHRTIADEHFTCIAEHARYCYRDRLRQIEIQREALRKIGQQSGFLASAHDYSKDIGSVLLRLGDFKDDLKRSAEAIEERARQLARLPAPAPDLAAAILIESHLWTVPSFDWFSGVRFTNAHLETQTRGILVPEPAECIAMLESGTLRDIEEIVRVLVWHPIPLEKLKQKEREFSKFAPNKLHLPSTWWTLFAFDLDPTPRSQSFHEQLGKKVRTLVLDEKITQPKFADRFKIPRIKSEVASLDDTRCILWPDGDWRQWRPLDGLLPLFVFSMRFAFQCSWAKTLLEEPKETLGIEINVRPPGEGKYELTIRFPSPLSATGIAIQELPYFGEWQAQIAHYTGSPAWKTSPWKVQAVTVPVTQGGRSDCCEIKLTATT